MTIILLIRHGNTDYLGSRLAGCTPGVHLNASGLQQAEQLTQALATMPIKAIFSSPLERTLETARPLAQRLRMPIHIERAFIEVNYGDLQGKTFKQIQRLKVWKQVHQAPSQVTFPGGEPFTAIQQRAVQAVTAICSQFAGADDLVACFTHGDVIRLTLAHYLGMPLDFFQRLFIQTASVSVVAFQPQKHTVLQINHQPGQVLALPNNH
jgi:probable phosphoglycerate mutase